MNNKTNTLLTVGIFAASSSLFAQGGFALFGESGPGLNPEQRTVRPISAPYYHEDAFITSDLRAWYVEHDFDSDTAGVLNNGSAMVAALQIRIALTERLQLVAYKDGYTEFDDAGALRNDSGVNDLAAGLKWAFIQDWTNQFHMAAGIGYELGVGDADVLQDSDELRLWISANKGFDRLHFGATLNFLKALDSDDSRFGNADMMTLHLHGDYYLTEWFSPVVELNGYLAQDKGVLPFSGVDAGSLPGGEENDTYTVAFGGELRIVEALGLRVAYETELNDNVSLFGDRWTLSAVYEF
ncbi:MAG: hypothetical protein GVY36_00840 [Verrucomicrobia bacterium]|jgi:hypothetical protein|nr:hypothetical protein [Verrucomicrobiota bacterium]